MAVRRFQLFPVPVSDPDRAMAFYVGVLGLRPVFDRDLGPDLRWLQFGPADRGTAVMLVDASDGTPPGSVRGLVLETDRTWDGPTTLTDPDGNSLTLRAPGGVDEATSRRDPTRTPG